MWHTDTDFHVSNKGIYENLTLIQTIDSNLSWKSNIDLEWSDNYKPTVNFLFILRMKNNWTQISPQAKLDYVEACFRVGIHAGPPVLLH